MVPTIRPSEYTSILAPTRCGVDPVVDTIVTSAAGSPRSSAAATAAKTSRFICLDYSCRSAKASRSLRSALHPKGARGFSRASAVELAELVRLGARQERLADHLRAARCGELAGLGVDVHEADARGHIERDARAAGERA